MKSVLQQLSLLVFLIFSNPSIAESIEEFTKEMQKKTGYYTFYYDQSQDKVFLQITQFNTPFLYQTSLPQGLGSNDIGLDRGQLGDTKIVQFERYGNKVHLVQLNTYYRANSNNAAEKKSIEEAFAKSVIQGFTVAAESNNKVLIDYTGFLLSDVHGVAKTLNNAKQGSYSLNTTSSAIYVARSKSFPKNTELEARLTFNGSAAGRFVRDVAPDANKLTVHMHHSLIELPDDNYTPRQFHPYSGYWSIEHKDYAVSLDDNMLIKYIPRHRLIKKDPNAEASEPKDPIVYWLDPGTPEPVRSALIDGAMWWEQAFEAAGFKNAFQVKILPEDADPMDVRYNTIQWVHRATRGWSYGSSVIDPRTGEIIKGHVTLGSLRVRQDYLIAQGLTAPFNSENTDTSPLKEMALARIRQLSAHEVGHTLGIAHNFAASANNRASVMDYPHPYVTLNKGKVDLSNAYDDKIGIWDKYVVQYGYGYPAKEQSEQQYLTSLVAATQASGLKYMSDPDARPLSGAHPTGHLWDNGDNAAKELTRVLKVRAKALEQFGLANLAESRALSGLQEVLVPIYLFHRYQVTAAAKLIAGVDYQYEIKISENAGQQAVSKEQQQNALSALLSTLKPNQLTLDKDLIKWLTPKSYGSYRNRESAPSQTSLVFDNNALASASISHTLSALLNEARLNRIGQQYALDQSPWSIQQYIEKIVTQTIKQPMSNSAQGVIQQRVAVLTLEHLMKSFMSNSLSIEAKSSMYMALLSINDWLREQQQGVHQLMHHHLSWYIEHRKWESISDITPMPPGSPI
jgi:hypothetical protein